MKSFLRFGTAPAIFCDSAVRRGRKKKVVTY